MLRHLFAAMTLFIATQSHATTIAPNAQISQLFAQAKANGTLVVYDVSKQEFSGHNPQRAATRFSPASTFKIANSLIGLASGAVADVDEALYHYDGKEQLYLDSWEQDTSLRTAIKVSHLPAYQLLARKIGLPQMQSNLNKMGYGNGKIGKSVETFWLDDSLKISAIEQTQFLAQLAQGRLPFPAQVQADVREIAKLETGKNWTLYGKTGWTGQRQPSTGWFVGWVEQDGRIYSFALNMQMPKVSTASDLQLRIDLAKAGLRTMGLMP